MKDKIKFVYELFLKKVFASTAWYQKRQFEIDLKKKSDKNKTASEEEVFIYTLY